MSQVERGEPERAGSSVTTHRRLVFLWIVYVAFIFYGCLIPFRYGGWEQAAENLSSIRWVPFVDADGSRASIPDVVQNVLFFMPFGMLGFVVLRCQRPLRIVIIGLLSIVLSMTVETLQLLTVDRTTSTTDVVTNFTGGSIGAGLAWLMGALSSAVPVEWQQRHARHESFFLVAVASILVGLQMLQPFDFALDVGMVGGRIKSLLRGPIEFDSMVRDEAVFWFQFALLGYASQLFFRDIFGDRGWKYAFGYAVALALVLEGMQIMVASRHPDLRDMLVAASGSIAGVLVCTALRGRMSRQLAVSLVLLATTVAATIQTISPFRLAVQPRGFNWIPFLAYYEVTSFNALSNFIESLLMYLPVGFVLQYLYPKRRVVWLVTLFIGASVLSLEYLQGFIEARYPDITDVLGAVVGGIFGCWVVQAHHESHDQSTADGALL